MESEQAKHRDKQGRREHPLIIEKHGNLSQNGMESFARAPHALFSG